MPNSVKVLIAFFCIHCCVFGQTIQEKIAVDLLNAEYALKEAKHYESITFLDKCQAQLGEQIIPRVEELYIENFSALKNPILLHEHLIKYFNEATSDRKGYNNILSLNKQNKKDLLKINREFKIKADSRFEGEKMKSLINLKKDRNSYYVNYLGNCVFSITTKEANGYRDAFYNGYVCVDNKIYNEQGEVVFSDKYDEVSRWWLCGQLSIKKDGKFGVLDTLGNYVIPPKYDAEFLAASGYLITEIKEKKGVLDKNNKVIIPFIYDDIIGNSISCDVKTDHFKVKLNGLYGLVDENNNILVPIEYEDVSFINESSYVKVQKDGKYGFLKDGKIQIPIVYEKEKDKYYEAEFNSFQDIIKKDKKYGVIDKNNKEITGFIYDSIRNNRHYNSCFHSKYIVMKEQKWGVIDSLGKEVIPFTYDGVGRSRLDEIVLIKNDKQGVFNMYGENIVPLEYDSIQIRNIGPKESFYTAIKNNVRYFYYNDKVIFKANNDNRNYVTNLPPLKKRSYKCGDITYFGYKVGVLVLGAKKRVVLYNGQSLFPKYEIEDLSFVTIYHKNYDWQFLNNDISVIAPKMSLVTLKNKKGKLAFADVSTGEIVTKFEYERVNDISLIYSFYKKGDKYGALDYNLEEMIPFDYDSLSQVKNTDLIKGSKRNKYGILDDYGNELIPFVYDYIDIFNENLIKVKRANKYGVINLENEIIIPIEYKDLKINYNRINLKIKNKWIEKPIE